MKQKSGTRESSSERLVKNIRRVTRKQYSSEEKIRIVLDGLRGEFSIAELCRREGIAESLYYSWSKEFLEAGKHRLAGDTARAATSSEDQRSVKLRVRSPPTGTHQCHGVTPDRRRNHAHSQVDENSVKSPPKVSRSRLSVRVQPNVDHMRR